MVYAVSTYLSQLDAVLLPVAAVWQGTVSSALFKLAQIDHKKHSRSPHVEPKLAVSQHSGTALGAVHSKVFPLCRFMSDGRDAADVAHDSAAHVARTETRCMFLLGLEL